MLELFGLNDKRDRPVGSLSGGMRRALDIVRGVIHHPRILFLDEPTIGLDLPNRRKIWRFIERLRASTGMTVLLTTHYLEEADSCDEVAFINSGKIVQRGTPRELVDQLGRHIVEIEARDLDPLSGIAFAPAGTRACAMAIWRCFAISRRTSRRLPRYRRELAGRVSAFRIRRPNLNDVFLWVNAAR